MVEGENLGNGCSENTYQPTGNVQPDGSITSSTTTTNANGSVSSWTTDYKPTSNGFITDTVHTNTKGFTTTHISNPTSNGVSTSTFHTSTTTDGDHVIDSFTKNKTGGIAVKTIVTEYEKDGSTESIISSPTTSGTATYIPTYGTNSYG
jgi:hypothetical protein